MRSEVVQLLVLAERKVPNLSEGVRCRARDVLEDEVNKVYTMRYDSHGSKGPGVYCLCGVYKIHRRGKVLVKWAKKHMEKTGHKWQSQS